MEYFRCQLPATPLFVDWIVLKIWPSTLNKGKETHKPKPTTPSNRCIEWVVSPVVVPLRNVTMVRVKVEVNQIPSQLPTGTGSHLQQMAKARRVHRFLVDLVQIVFDQKVVVTYFESPVQTVLHDGDEFLVRQQPIAVLVEDGEDRVDQVRVQLRTGADLDGAGEFV